MICPKCYVEHTEITKPKSGRVCKPCISLWHKNHFQKVKKEHIAKCKDWGLNNPDRKNGYDLKSRLKRIYGITVGEYQEMLKYQDFKCAICLSENPKRKGARNFFVDHNHKTGFIRGLLCHRCNLAVGLVEEDQSIIMNLSRYLK